MHSLEQMTRTLMVVQRWSETYGVMHVALAECVPSRSDLRGALEPRCIVEFSHAAGMTVRPFDAREHWTFVGGVGDEQAARARLNELLQRNDPYDLLLNNCEHMVSYVADGVRHSPQVRRAAFAVAGVIGLVALLRPKTRRAA